MNWLTSNDGRKISPGGAFWRPIGTAPGGNPRTTFVRLTGAPPRGAKLIGWLMDDALLMQLGELSVTDRHDLGTASPVSFRHGERQWTVVGLRYDSTAILVPLHLSMVLQQLDFFELRSQDGFFDVPSIHIPSRRMT